MAAANTICNCCKLVRAPSLRWLRPALRPSSSLASLRVGSGACHVRRLSCQAIAVHPGKASLSFPLPTPRATVLDLVANPLSPCNATRLIFTCLSRHPRYSRCVPQWCCAAVASPPSARTASKLSDFLPLAMHRHSLLRIDHDGGSTIIDHDGKRVSWGVPLMRVHLIVCSAKILQDHCASLHKCA